MLDMTELKRIDFEKCKLANLDDVPLAIELSNVSIRIVSAETGTVILFREFDNEWETDDGSILSNKAQIDEIFARGATVDAFIERELRLIYAIENPPTPGDGYELCTAERAKSDCDAEYKFISRNTNAWYREWQKVSGCIWGDEETYVFRCPIAKPKNGTIEIPTDVELHNITVVYGNRKYRIQTYEVGYPGGISLRLKEIS